MSKYVVSLMLTDPSWTNETMVERAVGVGVAAVNDDMSAGDHPCGDISGLQ